MILKNRLIVLFILSLSFPQFLAAQDTLSTEIMIDSLGNEVYYLTNKKQQPIYYYSPVFTPVCIDGTCYPIQINIYWDLAGNYVKYTLPVDEILTKNEHLPFSEFDYSLLHRMIGKKPSALANYSIYDLTVKEDAEIDGSTGATRPELQGAFVPDALFTTYTLWHLVRRPKAQLVAFTREKLIPKVGIHYLLNNQSLGFQQIALAHLLTTSNEPAAAVLGPIIDSTDNDLTALCIGLIPLEEFKTEFIRIKMAALYASSEVALVKNAILDRWLNFEDERYIELVTVAKCLGKDAETYQSEFTFLKQAVFWPAEVYELVYNRISLEHNMMRRQALTKLLYAREEQFPKRFKKFIK